MPASPPAQHRITRYRPPRTCIACRTRKLKCDRGRPCSSCIKRQDTAACEYRSTPDAIGSNAAGDVAQRGEARLRHLEHLVREFANSSKRQDDESANTSSVGQAEERGSEAASLTTGDEIPRNDSGVRLETSANGVYVGSTNYLAMIEDIEELKRIFSESDTRLDDDGIDDGDRDDFQQEQAYETSVHNECSILFGSAQAPSLQQILAQYLPCKKVTDRCLATYFRAEILAAPFIHVPQFREQYEAFWENQLQTSPLWVSSLFSMCQISKNVGVAPADETLPDFSVAAALCLACGKYSRPQPFGVEALVLYIEIKVVEGWDPSHELGVLFSTAMQLAYSRGYHRDPTHFSHITPFEGEMRRRTWSLCLQLNLLCAFHLGLPCNIPAGSWDTRIPGNYLDSDLTQDMLALPTPRPPTDLTRQLSFNAKHLLMTIFHKILQYTTSFSQTAGDEKHLQSFNTELEEAYATIPSELRHRSVSASLGDKGFLIASRRCVELLYQKCRCVLHRRSMARAHRPESLRICANAAATIVQSFLDMYPEFKPGGQFFHERWLLSSLTWNDFLLGIMVLVIVLCLKQKPELSRILRDSPLGEEVPDDAALVEMLRASLEVCREKITESVGARRAVKVLESLLGHAPSLQRPERSAVGGNCAELSMPSPDLTATEPLIPTAPSYQASDFHQPDSHLPVSFAPESIAYPDWDFSNTDLFAAEEWDSLEAQLFFSAQDGISAYN